MNRTVRHLLLGASTGVTVFAIVVPLIHLLAEKLPAREPDPAALQALSAQFRARLEARRSPLFHELFAF